MRFRTLQFKLSLILLAFGLLAIGLSAVRQYHRDVNSSLDQLRLRAYQEGTRLASLAQHFFRRRLPNSADLALSYASVDPDLHLGVICDGGDRVLYATQKQWRGLSLWSCPLAVTPHLVSATRQSFEGVLNEDAALGRLTAVFPFRDAANGVNKGLVVLEYDLYEAAAAAARQALNESAAQSCLLLGGCVLLWALLQVMVAERVSKIVEQTHHIRADGEVHLPLKGNDELAGISASIAEAARQLRASEWRFSQVAASMRDIFWVAPPHKGEPVYVNEAYTGLSGRDAARLPHRRWDWLRAVAREDRRSVLEMLHTLRAEPGELELEFRIHGEEGTKWLRCRGFSVRRDGTSASSLQVAGVAADITGHKEMQKRLLQATENERRRIGQDLHDDVCQRLAAAQLKSGVLQSTLRREAHPKADLAGDVAVELAEASELARAFARGLAPVAMRVEEMSDALDDLKKFIQRAFSIRCDIACDDMTGLLQTEDAAQVFRITQELTTNAAKHGRASWVSVSLMAGGGVLRVEVAHDGARFDPERREDGNAGSGMGLHMVRQRVDALGGSLAFIARHAAEGGTIAVCELPLRVSE
ncbi:MAG TPA: ATP-binding protein [Prosthecobacter sp.]